MRLLYTLLAVIAACSFSHAQVAIGQENAPLVGDSWAAYNFIIPSALVPVPTVGMATAYDFTAVGELIDDDFGVAIKDIILDSLFRVDILAVPAGSDDPAFDDLPATALLTSTVFPELDEEGNTFMLSNIIDVREDGVYTLGEQDFVFVNGEVIAEYVRLPEPELIFTFDEAFGASTTTEVSAVEDDVDFGTQDSTYRTETTTYAGYGSLRTWFADYDQIAVYKTVSQFRLYTRPIGSTDDFSIASAQVSVDYDFIRPGSFAPVVSYSYDTFNADTQPVPEDVNFFVSQPLNLTDVTTVSAEQLRFSAAPNPATESVSVSFTQPAAGPASLRLYDLTGREVLERDLGVLSAGDQQVRVDLPDNLRAGSFVLRITSDGKTAAMPLVIR